MRHPETASTNIADNGTTRGSKQHGNGHRWFPIWMACAAFAFSACTRSYTDAERARIAAAYAETLMAHHMHTTDSVRMHAAADSIAGALGFSDEHDLQDAIAAMTEQPEDLRKMLDTADRYLQRISAKVPPPTSTAQDTTKKTRDTQEHRFSTPPTSARPHPAQPKPSRTKK